MNRAKYLDIALQSAVATSNKQKDKQTAKPSKYPQGFFKPKKCKHCGELFSPKAPSEMYCSDKCKDYGVLEAYYKRTYNITLDEYLDMAEQQNFVCQLCKQPNFPMRSHHSGALLVDHDHKTGEVRGLLCHNCNRALGLLHDDTAVLQRAINYLESATTIRKE